MAVECEEQTNQNYVYIFYIHYYPIKVKSDRLKHNASFRGKKWLAKIATLEQSQLLFVLLK
jgi:hypothetical protein